MAEIGATDEFEGNYVELFRQLVRPRGEFVHYERDRALRDIGVHFTKSRPGGGRDVTSALAWFQLKGIMSGTLPAKELGDVVKTSLYVKDLRFWYLQAATTYLALFVESANKFLVLNLKKYVDERWGRGIFELKQEKVSIEVPVASVLDDHAMDLIVRESDADVFVRALGVEELVARQCLRDHQLIWRIGTASERKVQQRVVYREWISKIRTTADFQEWPPGASEWTTIRSHWGRHLSWAELQAAYPHIEFFASHEEAAAFSRLLDEEEARVNVAVEMPADEQDGHEEDEEDEEDFEDGDDDEDELGLPSIRLKTGVRVYGQDIFGECEEFVLAMTLNSLGRRLHRHVQELVRLGFVTVDEERAEFLSYAPWDERHV